MSLYCIPKVLKQRHKRQNGKLMNEMTIVSAQELAQQAHAGLRPSLWIAMKDKGCPTWRESGSSATQADAARWITLLSDDEIRRALGCPDLRIVRDPAWANAVKEQLYKTAMIRKDIGFDHIQGMLPGEIVAVKYWKHVYDGTTTIYRPLYYIAKTNDFERHIKEGSFATVYNSALENFCL
jgi:hypothetical protein